MRGLIILIALCFLCGCITEYELRGIEEVDGILVVDGIITDYESVITLSRSRHLTSDDWEWTYEDPIFDARVYVEREDGTRFPAEPPNINFWGTPARYVINNGKLDPNSRYRLRIEIDEFGEMNNMDTFEYFSEFSHPIITPEIDSVFWMKRSPGQPVTIRVATHSPDRQVLFYRWSFREDWEINADFFHQDFPFRCWNFAYSRNLLLGSAERTILGRVTDIIHEMEPQSRRLSVLYRIDVTQNAISKRAYDYFENIRRNTDQTGSIFAPIPSELRGNIYSATDPSRYVIGFIEVSTTTQKRLYIARRDGAYERPHSWCRVLTQAEICEGIEGPCNPLDFGYILFENMPGQPPTFILPDCVDCTYFGTTQRPHDWPN
jgi:hypothetical protein